MQELRPMNQPHSDNSQPPDATARPYVGILFECCNVYARIYRRPEQTEYRGGCPRCGKLLKLRVGPDGTSSRMFRAK
jgi:hypothetical protein